MLETLMQTSAGHSSGIVQAAWDFLHKGGIFMIPIGIVSLLVLTFVIDRGIGLRAGKLFPGRFRKSIQQFSKQKFSSTGQNIISNPTTNLSLKLTFFIF